MLTEYQIERAADLYRGGPSLANVGTESGVTGMTIRQHLLPIRPRQGWERRLDAEEA